MKGFLLITDTSGEDHLINISYVTRIYTRKNYSPADKQFLPRFSIDVAGACSEGLSSGVRIDITEQQLNLLKEQLLNIGED